MSTPSRTRPSPPTSSPSKAMPAPPKSSANPQPRRPVPFNPPHPSSSAHTRKSPSCDFTSDEKESPASSPPKSTAFFIAPTSPQPASSWGTAASPPLSSTRSAIAPPSPRRRGDGTSSPSLSGRPVSALSTDRPSSASISDLERSDSLLQVISSTASFSSSTSTSPQLSARSSHSEVDVQSFARSRRSEPSLPPSFSSVLSSSSLPRESDVDFDALDGAITRSSTFTEVFRIVRWCAGQTSVDRMVTTLEMQLKALLSASTVRFFLLQGKGLIHYSHPHPIPPVQSNGLLGWVFAHRQLVNLTHPSADARWNEAVDGIHDRPSPSACLCAALEGDPKPDCNTQRETVGVLQVLREREGEAFSARDGRVLALVADLLGNVVKNSNSVDRAHSLYLTSLQSNRRSNALLDVAKALASETSLERIVSIIVSQVPELLDSDRCTLYFVDREQGQLMVTKGASQGRPKNLVSWIFGQSNAPELPFPVGANELRFPITSGLAGHVASTGETLNIGDAHQDPRFNSTMDKETGYRTRSSLCVPMIDGNGVIIGVVQAINKNPLYPRFDKEDETLLKTFSAQAALAVRNSQLFQRTTSALRQADALLEVTQALSSELKIEALIAIICSKVQSLLGSERCTVFIVDKERKELYTTESMSYGMGPSLPIDRDKATLISFPMDRGIAGAVATTGLPVNIPDAYKDSRFNQTMDKETGFRTRSILCMAIKNHRGEIAGVLQVMNKKHGTFDEEDEKLLSAFCAQAAVAIENSRLFQQTERALNHALADQRNLKFMLSVTKNLFSDLHLTSMIDQMTMQVHHLLKADDCALYLVDEEKKEFWLAREEEEGTVRKFPFLTGIVGQVAQTAETIRISSHAHADSRFNSVVDQRRGKVTHSILCCPIKAELQDDVTKVVGVISVRDEKDRGGFEQEEEKLLKVFCAQAAVAIMNSKRFSAIMEQSEVKESDHSAAEYLVLNRGMNLASDDINSFQYRMEEIVMKGAIGTGSYGEVYRALVRGKIVAVKKLHVRNLRAEQIDSFCQEASLMCQLNHPNIVGFIGAVTEPSNLCILTHFCNRGSLADLLLEGTVDMNFHMKLQCALDAAMGMLYLHNSNPVILHRDLKSDNLLVTQDWTVKVAGQRLHTHPSHPHSTPTTHSYH